MTASTSGGVVDHRAAADALDELTGLVEARNRAAAELAAAEQKVDARARLLLAMPGITQEQVAARLGISARGLRKRLAS